MILILCSCLLDDEQKDLLTKISEAEQAAEHVQQEVKREGPQPTPTPTTIPTPTPPPPLSLPPPEKQRRESFIISNSSTSHMGTSDRASWLTDWSKKHHEQPEWSREVLFLVTAPLSPPIAKKQFMQDSLRKQQRQQQQKAISDNELIVVPAGMTKGLCAHELTVGRFVTSPTRTSSQSTTSASPCPFPFQNEHSWIGNNTSSSSECARNSSKSGDGLCSCSDISCSLGVSVRSPSASLTTKGSHAMLRAKKVSDGGNSVDTAFNLHS